MSKQLKQEVADLAKRIAEIQEYLDEKPPVKLFAGARCERRDGDVVTIQSRDDSKEFCGVIYPFLSNDQKSYMEDGVFLEGCKGPRDIIRVLNPEDHPDNRPPVEYREINFTDIGRTVYWTHDKTTAGVLGGVGAFPNGSPAAFVFTEEDSAHEVTPTSLVIQKLPDDKAVHEGWVNIYAGAHPSRDAADKYADSDRIACIRIQYYEGQMDA